MAIGIHTCSFLQNDIDIELLMSLCCIIRNALRGLQKLCAHFYKGVAAVVAPALFSLRFALLVSPLFRAAATCFVGVLEVLVEG